MHETNLPARCQCVPLLLKAPEAGPDWGGGGECLTCFFALVRFRGLIVQICMSCGTLSMTEVWTLGFTDVRVGFVTVWDWE